MAVAGAIGTALVVFVTRLVPWINGKLNEHALRLRLGAGQYHPSILRAAVRHYIEPLVTNVDAGGRESIRALLPVTRPLFGALDEVLLADEPQRLLLLADSGMGKTSALLNYYARHVRRRRRRKEVALVHLGSPDALARIAEVPDKTNTALLLDALDEDVVAIRNHEERIRQLMQATRDYGAVLISCRTQFFLKDEEITRETGIARIGPRPAGMSGDYQLLKLYLAPFTDAQVSRYIEARYPWFRRSARREAKAIVAKLADLTARPMLLANIDDLLAIGREQLTLSRAYHIIVEAWLERERFHVGNVDALRQFSIQLAMDIYLNRDKRQGEYIYAPEIRQLARVWGIDLDDWKLTGRSLLNRDADGRFKFAHRSIMEYLFVRAFLSGNGWCARVKWTDLMQNFVVEHVQAFGGADLIEPMVSGNPPADLVPTFVHDLLEALAQTAFDQEDQYLRNGWVRRGNSSAAAMQSIAKWYLGTVDEGLYQMCTLILKSQLQPELVIGHPSEELVAAYGKWLERLLASYSSANPYSVMAFPNETTLGRPRLEQLQISTPSSALELTRVHFDNVVWIPVVLAGRGKADRILLHILRRRLDADATMEETRRLAAMLTGQHITDLRIRQLTFSD